MRRRLETQTCAPADPNLASEPVVLSTFRRAARPAAASHIRGPGPGRAEPGIQQDLTTDGHAFSRPARQPSGQRRRVLTPVPDRSPPPPAIDSPVDALHRYPQVTYGGRLLAPYRPPTSASASVLVLACPSPISAAGATSSAVAAGVVESGFLRVRTIAAAAIAAAVTAAMA